jgi:molybdopterin converting factor small subunit
MEEYNSPKNTIESLERRVQSISEHLGNHKVILSQNETVSSLYAKLLREYDSLMITNINSDFIQKYQNLITLINENDVKALLLNTFVKAEFVLKFEHEIREVARQLEKIEALKRFLDFEPLHNLHEKRKILRILELHQIEINFRFSVKEKEFMKLLEEYNQVIIGINDQMIEWDEKLGKSIKNKPKD